MGLDSVRDLAIERLDPIASPVDKIVEGTACGVDRWLAPSIAELCGREKFLTLDESIRLGVRRVHLIANVREHIAGTGPHSKRSRQEAIRKMVEASLCEGDDTVTNPQLRGMKSAPSDSGELPASVPDPDPLQIPKQPPTSSSPRPNTLLHACPSPTPHAALASTRPSPSLDTRPLPSARLPSHHLKAPTSLEAATVHEPSHGARGSSDSGGTEDWPERIKELRQGKKKRRKARAGAVGWE